MPSDTFLRLNEEKKKKLLNAGFKEFSTASYIEASINKIIKESDISRGSFYMYFDSKKDLYFYLIDAHADKMVNKMKRLLIDNDGDLFLTFKEIASHIYMSSMESDNLNFFKKILENVTLMEEYHKTFGFSDKRLLKAIIPNVNLKLLKNVAKDQVEVIFAVNMHLLMINLIRLLKEGENKDEVLNSYYSQLDLLKYGVYKERKEKDV